MVEVVGSNPAAPTIPYIIPIGARSEKASSHPHLLDGAGFFVSVGKLFMTVGV